MHTFAKVYFVKKKYLLPKSGSTTSRSFSRAVLLQSISPNFSTQFIRFCKLANQIIKCSFLHIFFLFFLLDHQRSTHFPSLHLLLFKISLSLFLLFKPFLTFFSNFNTNTHFHFNTSSTKTKLLHTFAFYVCVII